MAALGAIAMLWPLALGAQEPAPGKWRIGTLVNPHRQEVLRLALRDLGYIEGQNLVIMARSNEYADRLPALAAELVGLKPDILVAGGTQATEALQRATRSIPIVMTGSSDPIGTHLAASLAHPGGNVTGSSLQSPELSGKRIELLREIAGNFSSLAVLWNPDDPPAVLAFRETQEAARMLGVQITAVEARSAGALGPAFQKIADAAPNALVVLTSSLMSVQAPRIAELALGQKLPSIYPDIAFPRAGGLMSYGPNFDSGAQRAASYIDRILKGEKPADLPIEQPTKFDLVVNLKTAKALALRIPPSMLAIADEAIE